MYSRHFRIAAVLLLLCLQVFMLSGCEKQIFQDKGAKYRMKAEDDDSLSTDVYYVKDGTKFFQVHELECSGSGRELDASKCAWAIKDETLIPSYYKNELIARAGKKIDRQALTLERFRDCGFSIALHGAQYEDGYISFKASSGTIKGTSARNAFDMEKSDNILIETINGVPVNETMLNEAGIITGMEQDAEYEITYYAGTYYGTATVTADTHFFQSYEIYSLNDIEITKNGYVSIKLPDDLECGYYDIDGAGFFKYYNFKKADGDTAEVDYNVPYYNSEEDQILAYSQQFVFNLDYAARNMSVRAAFEPNSVTNSSGMVMMLLTTPDGRHMKVETEKDTGEILCDMDESMPGEWLVNLTPQSMTVTDVQIISNKEDAEATKEVYTLDFDQDMTGVIFTLQYEGSGEVTAQITDEDSKSYEMVKKSGTNNDIVHTMEYSFAYLPAGEYKVNVFHYPDTKILKADYYLSEDVKDIDIITVED